MKQTTNYGLNLMETADYLSVMPLNENSEKLDTALKALTNITAGKLMIATGSYTGTGTRVVSILTPGFTPKAMLLRQASGTWDQTHDAQWWLGSDIPVSYRITASSDTPPGTYEPGEQFDATISTTIEFRAKLGSLSWQIPDIPQEYYDVTSDGGSTAVKNSRNISFEWIAFGVAE